MKSYVGNCPTASFPGGTFNLTLPADTPANPSAVFSWTWFDNMGSRYMYMTCAVVDINGMDTGHVDSNHPFLSRSTFFTANIGQGSPPIGDCSTPKASSTNGNYSLPATTISPTASIAVSGEHSSVTKTTPAFSTSDGSFSNGLGPDGILSTTFQSLVTSAFSSASHPVPAHAMPDGTPPNEASSTTPQKTSAYFFAGVTASKAASAMAKSKFSALTHTATFTETAGVQPQSTNSLELQQPGSAIPKFSFHTSLADPILLTSISTGTTIIAHINTSTVMLTLTITRTQYPQTASVIPDISSANPYTIVTSTKTISIATITRLFPYMFEGYSVSSGSTSMILTKPIVLPIPPETLNIPSRPSAISPETSSSSLVAQAGFTGPTPSTKLSPAPTTRQTITRSVEL